MRVFRLGLARFLRTRKEAFSGKGGVVSSGRWHTAGHPIVYAAQSLSLAALEILVHLKQTRDVEPFLSYTADIPDNFILKPQPYPTRWKSRIDVSRAFGDAWLAAKVAPALRVPTILAPGEWNVLLNPLHPQFSLGWIQAGPERFAFDARLLTRKQPKSHRRRGSRFP
jgi:RES domain-containing protein